MVSLLRNFLFFVLIFSLLYVFLSKKYIFVEDTSQKTSDSLINLDIGNRREKNYSSFLKEIKNKEVFVLPKIDNKFKTPIVNKDELNKIKDNLRLVGIISEGTYKVIIEDIRIKKTFYIKEEDVFLEKIKVIKIGNNSVILNCFGEEFELYL